MIRGVHHVQVTIPIGEETAGRAFYCGVLGLEEISKAEALRYRGGFWVRAGTIDIHIGVENGINRSESKAHVAYQVSDLGVWREKLASAGVAIRKSIPIPGYDRLEFRDPFGNRIELIQPAKGSVR